MSKTVPVPGQLLDAAGRALHGERWVNPLAHTLGINERTTQRWADAGRKGEAYQVSRTLLEELVGHLEARMLEAGKTVEALAALLG